MYKKINIVFLLFSSQFVFAAGIPTFDPVMFGSFVKEALEAKNRFDQTIARYKEQINQAQNINSRLEAEAKAEVSRQVGNLNLALPDPTSVAFINQKWKEDQVAKQTRDVLSKNDAYQNNKEQIDSLTKATNFVSQLQQSNNTRQKKVELLFHQLNKVQTPKDKQDLNNALLAEILQLQIDKMKIEAEEKIIEKEQQVQQQIALQQFENKHFRR